MGAHDKSVGIKTRDVSVALGSSQQTASRWLIEMEKAGLIQRSWEGRTQKVQITKEGLLQLASMHRVLKDVFESSPGELVMNGAVFSGMSEGSYYMSLDGYRKQFKAKLGFDPYPGTLNLRVRKEDQNQRRMLESFPFIHIEGFSNSKRSYGPAKCFRTTVNEKVESAIVLPIRAHYGEDVVEIIAPQQLRKLLKLKDGDTVRVRVTGPN